MRGEHEASAFIEFLYAGSSPHAWGTHLHRERRGHLDRFIPTCVGNTAGLTARTGRTWVHPHMRGEHLSEDMPEDIKGGSSPHAWGTPQQAYWVQAVTRFIPTCVGNTPVSFDSWPAATGSSPHAWGTHLLGPVLKAPLRFIPTCVGNTEHGQPAAGPAAVHPHMRGEHSHLGEPPAMDSGSSPHAWGTPVESACERCAGRFIPTCVGNTAALLSSSASNPVHPHMRGEHPVPSSMPVNWCGSSPHAWGTLRAAHDDRLRRRFIPTCVGNTQGGAMGPAADTVHPHMRGEHVSLWWLGGGCAGSSPHAWGTRQRGSLAEALPRFIPTCVGNTQRWASDRPSTSVHPHMRGEHAVMAVGAFALLGSSPHAWGTPKKEAHKRLQDRFIPTCVGNTRRSPSHQMSTTVHPHMRGEHACPGFDAMSSPGSSPHAWGTLSGPGLRCPRSRFIPTCVGNTPAARQVDGSRPVHPHMRGEHTQL